MRKFIYMTLFWVIVLVLVGCASAYNPSERAPGFLPDYSLLKPIPSNLDGVKLYVYDNPQVKRGDYHAAIIESVVLYQNTVESSITIEKIEKVRTNIDDGIRLITSKKIAITTTPKAGVVRIEVAITGATVEKEGFKLWNIIPISAAIKLASIASELDNKTPVLVVELKLSDSQSGKLLREVVSIISGDNFRLKSNTSGEFEKLAISWVEQALIYSQQR